MNLTNAIKTLCTIAMIMLLTSCSWNEYFIISNTSQSVVTINYKIKAVKNGFPIFTNQPSIYKISTPNVTDWQSEQKPVDTDTSLTGFSLKIPAHYAVNIGVLNNDQYTAYNQYFINSRVFNLLELEIVQNNDTLKIFPTTFDTYFKKIKRNIVLEIK